ncbi:hypothetical protein F5Y10DRAFT_273817 [Nemania abortiva]|nr:hypothetical protein F5Y10DRAFT_273817 [Nemania abortiva]
MFKAAEIQDAFRYMPKGTHIDRIGMSIRPPSNKAKRDFELVKDPCRLKSHLELPTLHLDCAAKFA